MLSEICVRRPVFATMLVMSLVVLGIFSFRDLGVDLFPRADPATVNVALALPGAAMRQSVVAKEFCDPGLPAPVPIRVEPSQCARFDMVRLDRITMPDQTSVTIAPAPTLPPKPATRGWRCGTPRPTIPSSSARTATARRWKPSPWFSFPIRCTRPARG